MTCFKIKALAVSVLVLFSSSAFAQGAAPIANPITLAKKGFDTVLKYCETREALSLIDRQREIAQEDLQKTTSFRDILVRIRDSQSSPLSPKDTKSLNQANAKVAQLEAKVRTYSTILNIAISPNSENRIDRGIKPSVFSVFDLNQDGAIDQADVDLWGACWGNHPTDFAKVPSCRGSVNGVAIDTDYNGDGTLSASDLSLMASAKQCYESNFPVYNPTVAAK